MRKGVAYLGKKRGRRLAAMRPQDTRGANQRWEAAADVLRSRRLRKTPSALLALPTDPPLASESVGIAATRPSPLPLSHTQPAHISRSPTAAALTPLSLCGCSRVLCGSGPARARDSMRSALLAEYALL